MSGNIGANPMETRTLEFEEATEAQRKAMGLSPVCLALAGRNW
ncbi:hypothetical protein Asd1617_06017 [Shigella dysenteriae 1617]|uniref:Uncharacterized protein n=1 Tax=Shigella dysenteriae 1617 TaxID=754093 RepID=A0A0A7A4A4_SHIDY|nr:hypothetical protein Asd1617_06017 [Shigella dysenteriae 1617]